MEGAKARRRHATFINRDHFTRKVIGVVVLTECITDDDPDHVKKMKELLH